jgi:hypothetical protein
LTRRKSWRAISAVAKRICAATRTTRPSRAKCSGAAQTKVISRLRLHALAETSVHQERFVRAACILGSTAGDIAAIRSAFAILHKTEILETRIAAPAVCGGGIRAASPGSPSEAPAPRAAIKSAAARAAAPARRLARSW